MSPVRGIGRWSDLPEAALTHGSQSSGRFRSGAAPPSAHFAMQELTSRRALPSAPSHADSGTTEAYVPLIACRGGAQCLEPGEGVLDDIGVGHLKRRAAQFCTARLDPLADPRSLWLDRLS
jgi:hypothetical protein